MTAALSQDDIRRIAEAVAERLTPAPHSMSPAAAAKHFGFSRAAFYSWVNDGRLIRGKHYLKVGKRIVIKRDEFIKWMEDENECIAAG